MKKQKLTSFLVIMCRQILYKKAIRFGVCVSGFFKNTAIKP